jgi:hypothetical protein
MGRGGGEKAQIPLSEKQKMRSFLAAIEPILMVCALEEGRIARRRWLSSLLRAL